MTSYQGAVKLLGVGRLALILSSGCNLAKKVGGERGIGWYLSR